jgi:hypothetical protein
MIQKVVHKVKLHEHNEIRQNLDYWLSRTPEERVAAVEFYRRQVYGNIPQLQRITQVLNVNKVEFVVAGAYALAFHGLPRFTDVLEILVKPDKENARRILKVLGEFGFGSLQLTEDDFCRPDTVVQLGYPPVRIDILTTLTGLTWEQILAGKTAGTMDSVPVFYLGKKELILNKKTLGRKKDLADIEGLE